MLSITDLQKLSAIEADIIIQNHELSGDTTPQAVEVLMMNQQQLEIIHELRLAALN